MFKEADSDYILSSAPFFQYVVLMLQDLLVSAGIVSPGAFRSVSIVLASLPMVMALIIIFRKKPKTFIVTYAIILYVILCNFIFFPQNKEFLLQGMFYLLCINVPCFLCILTIDDFTVLKKVMLQLSYPITLMGLMYFLFLLTGIISLDQYDMAFGYYLLIPAVVFLSQGRLLFTVLFLVTCILILLIGSRGALLAALIYASTLMLIDRKGRSGIFLFGFFVVLLAAIILITNPGLINMSDMSYRTLSMIRDGGLTDDSNRLSIFSLVFRGIMDSPVWGHGIYGDRLILEGYYSHNFFLEFLYNFGIYLGTFLITLLFYKFGGSLVRLNAVGKKMLLMFFCFCFVPLMYSKSYLNDPGFGLFIGITVALPKMRNLSGLGSIQGLLTRS
jgi:hypothetical protein